MNRQLSYGKIILVALSFCILLFIAILWPFTIGQTQAQENTIFLPLLFDADGDGSGSTPTLTPTTAPSETPASTLQRDWDPRLDQRFAELIPAEPTDGQGYWRLIKGKWLDEEEAGGRVNIFVDTLDQAGDRQTGVPLLISWADGESTIVTEEKPGEPAANFAMFTWAPAYDIRPNDGNLADRVNGLGLGSIEQPRFNIHTGYEFTWQWTIHSATEPTPIVSATVTVSPTVSLTVSPTMAQTPTITPTTILTQTGTPTVTSVPTTTSTVTPTTTVTTTPTATLTPTLTPTPTPTSTPTATPEEQFTFSGELVDCSPNDNQTLLNGTVYVNDEPAPGYRVIFDFEANGDGVTPPQITRGEPTLGFYEHIIGEGSWFVWIVNEAGERISTQVPFTIDQTGGDCRIVTVDFRG